MVFLLNDTETKYFTQKSVQMSTNECLAHQNSLTKRENKDSQFLMLDIQLTSLFSWLNYTY